MSAKIIALFKQFEPNQVMHAPDILNEIKGREQEYLQQMYKKYNTVDVDAVTSVVPEKSPPAPLGTTAATKLEAEDSTRPAHATEWKSDEEWTKENAEMARKIEENVQNPDSDDSVAEEKRLVKLLAEKLPLVSAKILALLKRYDPQQLDHGADLIKANVNRQHALLFELETKYRPVSVSVVHE